MKAFRLSIAARNAELDALASIANGATLNIYTGAQPLTADEPIKSQILIASLKLGKTAFKPANDATLTANTITEDPEARATGNPSFYRVASTSGKALWDGSIGRSDADLILDSSIIQKGARVRIESLQIKL